MVNKALGSFERCHIDAANAMLDDDVKRLSGLQERRYADHRWAVLIVLQGMDAAGKDGWSSM